MAVTSVKSSCCPEGAWGSLSNPDYETLGSVQTLEEELDLYLVGNSSKCIIWNYDIFGFDSGRTRQMADFLAAHGYMVLLPDYYRGTFIDPSQAPPQETVAFIKEQSDWNGRLGRDFLAVKQYGQDLGCKNFGSIGTCWGSYPVIRMSEDVDVKAGISMHPSHPNLLKLLEEDETELLKSIKSPQMFLPSETDAESVKANGLSKQILGDSLEIVEFNYMKHGWTVRGDLSDPVVERDVKKAFNLVLAFFGKYLHS